MRYRAVKCDICGKDMTNDDHQYRFKHKAYFGDERISRKLDMCETCYEDFESFVAGNNQLRKDGLNPIALTRQIHIGKIKKRKKQ